MTRIIEGDTVGAAGCLELLRGITSHNPAKRQGWAVIADNWFGSGRFDYTEDVTVAWVLAWAAVREPPGGLVRSDLLDALQGMAIEDRAPRAALELVTSAIHRSDVSPAEIDFYDDLVMARRPEPDGPPGGGGRSLGATRCLELVRGLASKSATDRQSAATAVAGQAVDAGESSTIATILAWAVESPSAGNRATAWLRSRKNSSVRPVLLSALLVLAEDGRVPVRVLDRIVTHLAGVRLDQVEKGFRIDLTAALRRSRG
jgi:hypothetical protein